MTGARRRKRRWLRAGVAVVSLVVLWIGAGVLFLGFPPVEQQPSNVDAIVVLGPVDTLRMSTAMDLIDQGFSDELVVSVPEDAVDRGEHLDICNDASLTWVHCFSPDPNATRGEAQYFASLAEQHGWESVMVVTLRSHMSRAYLYFARCFDGEISMVNDQIERPTSFWRSQFIYETGAFVKFSVIWSC